MLFAAALHQSLEGYLARLGSSPYAPFIDRVLRELENARETVIASYGLPVMPSAQLPLDTTYPRSDRAELYIAAPDIAEPYTATHLYLTFIAPDLAQAVGCSEAESRILLEFASILADHGDHHFGPNAEWGISPWAVFLGPSILAPEQSSLTLDPDGHPSGPDSGANLRQVFDAQVAGVFALLPTSDQLEEETINQDIEVAIQRLLHASVISSCSNLFWTSFKEGDQEDQQYPGRFCLPGGIDVDAGRVVCEDAPFSSTDGDGAYDMILTFEPVAYTPCDRELH